MCDLIEPFNHYSSIAVLWQFSLHSAQWQLSWKSGETREETLCLRNQGSVLFVKTVHGYNNASQYI